MREEKQVHAKVAKYAKEIISLFKKVDETELPDIIVIEIDFQYRYFTQMQNNTAIKFAPVYTDEQKVEVSLQDNQAVVRLSTWTEGLGWCVQKTMALDAEMLDELHRVLTAARMKIKRDAVDNEDEILSATVLEFPKFN